MAGQPQVVTKAGEPGQKPVPMEHRAVFEAALHDMRHKYGVPADRAEVLARRLTVIHAKIELLNLMTDRHAHLPSAIRSLKTERNQRAKELSLATVHILGRESALLSEAALSGKSPDWNLLSTSRAIENNTNLLHQCIDDPRPSIYVLSEGGNRRLPPYEFLVAEGESAVVTLDHKMCTMMHECINECTIIPGSVPPRLPMPLPTDEDTLEKIATSMGNHFHTENIADTLADMQTGVASSWKALWAEVRANATKGKEDAAAEQACADRSFDAIIWQSSKMFNPFLGPLRS